jgi:hypothetical protein
MVAVGAVLVARTFHGWYGLMLTPRVATGTVPVVLFRVRLTMVPPPAVTVRVLFVARTRGLTTTTVAAKIFVVNATVVIVVVVFIVVHAVHMLPRPRLRPPPPPLVIYRRVATMALRAVVLLLTAMVLAVVAWPAREGVAVALIKNVACIRVFDQSVVTRDVVGWLALRRGAASAALVALAIPDLLVSGSVRRGVANPTSITSISTTITTTITTTTTTTSPP